MTPPSSVPAGQARRWLWLPLLLLGCLTITVAWMLLALSTGRQNGWFAVVAALDAALMLRMGGMARGGLRALTAATATALVIAAANWGIASAYIGGPMGLTPWESILKMGPHYAWTLAGLANSTADLVWMGVALVVAAVASR
jgi:hypothetical protein